MKLQTEEEIQHEVSIKQEIIDESNAFSILSDAEDDEEEVNENEDQSMSEGEEIEISSDSEDEDQTIREIFKPRMDELKNKKKEVEFNTKKLTQAMVNALD